MRYASNSKRGGFTLLEVLVAMTILAILAAALFTMFSQSSGAWQRAEARTEQFVVAREALGLIALELRQAIVAPQAGRPYGAHFYGLAPGDNTFGRPNPDDDVTSLSGQVYFVAPTEIRDENANQDLCVIGYWVTDTDKLMRYCLSDDHTGWRSFSPTENVESQELSGGIRSLTFKFWDDRPSNPTWDDAVDSWVTDDSGPLWQRGRLPQAVRITLVVNDPSLPENHPDAEKRARTFTAVVYMSNSSR